jgi:hypothetical protein
MASQSLQTAAGFVSDRTTPAAAASFVAFDVAVPDAADALSSAA